MKDLTSKEAKKRLKKFGKNEIKRTRKVSPIRIFFSQFTSPLILVLIVAAIISFIIGHLPDQPHNTADAILILIIVFFSGVAGFIQEYKAEKTVEALQKISTPKIKVMRDGKEVEIDIGLVVPRDTILLEEGDVVPADAKLIEGNNIQFDEAVLTGESTAIRKKKGDIIFRGAFVNSGSGKAIVFKTGMQTKLGAIAEKLQEMKEEKSPFKKELDKFSKKVLIAISAIILVIFLVSILKYSLYQSLLTGISLAVAAIPEGLPAVLIFALAIGAKSMADKHALVRKLSVVESAGGIDIICADKTGTITRNQMEVVKLFADDKVVDSKKIKTNKIISYLLTCGALCNNAKEGYDHLGKKKYFGDQTEIALMELSNRNGFTKEKLNRYSRIDELPFSSKRKMMSVIYKEKGRKEYTIFSKGAPEILLNHCSKIMIDGKIRALNKGAREKILEQNEKFASDALRVLGFALKNTSDPEKDTEKDLVWIGLQAMIDSPRKEVKNALKKCRSAGIRVMMLTGDNPSTASAIANKIGLKSNGVLTGKELDSLDDAGLKQNIKNGINIFARISPQHKLRILGALKQDYRVAMTGDGVNDALALKKADVGIAMGIKGTDVAKQASDIIFLDDNFATIITAIKGGRRAFDNIRKFVNYLFVCNLAEVLVIFLATIFLTLKEPIMLPVQLLWINLLTDGLPALALGIDPARPMVMKEPPRGKYEHIIDKRQSWLIWTIGIKKTLILLATFFILLPLGTARARTALFTGFILYEFVRIGSIRYQDKLTWLSNKWLLAALIGSVILQLIILYTPLSSYFYIVPLGWYEWAVLLTGVVVGYLLAIMITKMVIKYTRDKHGMD